jgi:hypothetical protein
MPWNVPPHGRNRMRPPTSTGRLYGNRHGLYTFYEVNDEEYAHAEDKYC